MKHAFRQSRGFRLQALAGSLRRFGLGAILLPLLAACADQPNESEGQIVGPAVLSATGVQAYNWTQAPIDADVTPSCGSVTAGRADTGQGEGASGGSEGGEEEQDEFTVNTFLQFTPTQNNSRQTMFIKFLYDRRRTEFNLTPTSTASQTCFTTDFINCNGSDGNPTCETTDGIKCGGAYTFIWTSESPALAFQAEAGSINYENGLSLNAEQNEVLFMELDINMSSADGSLFQGKLTCTTNYDD